MYGIVNNSASMMTCIAKIRRLSTPSFGDKPLSVDSYVTQWRWYWKDNDGAWLIYANQLKTPIKKYIETKGKLIPKNTENNLKFIHKVRGKFRFQTFQILPFWSYTPV
jgi:hypothetical protein